MRPLPPGATLGGRLLSALALAIASALATPGCGDDEGGGFKPEDPFRDTTTSENVLYDFAECFNQRDYEHFVPLFEDDFTFVFTEDDVDSYPSRVPQDGTWSRGEMLEAAGNMLDEDHIPCDPSTKIAKMTMELVFFGAPMGGVSDDAQGPIRGGASFLKERADGGAPKRARLGEHRSWGVVLALYARDCD